MNRIDNSGQGIASLGRDEDQYMAHVAQGEMVVPPVISQKTRQRIQQEMKAAGLSPDEYKVGDGMSINPITGMPEFGWLKKTFKSIKKVAKKVAPVIGPLANFIPGVGPLLSAAIQAGTTKLAGGSWKDALKAGAFSYGAGKLAGGIGGLGKGAGAAKTGGNFFGNAKEFLFKGKDGVGLFGNLGKGIGGLKDRAGEFLFKGDDGVGLFGNMFGGGEGAEYEIQPGDNLTDIAAQNGTTVEALMKANGITDPNMIQAGAKLIVPSSSGGFNIGRNILGKGNTPDWMKGFEDKLKGEDGNFGGGGMGNAGIMGISALLGKLAYESAKDREGGLAATPEITMDNLGRYSLSKALGTGGTREEFGLGAAPKSFSPEVFAAMGGPIDRQYFNQGGLAAIAEQDMREGGESEGPGTGTSDDIPAMLSDGEFVMTAAATKGAGAFNVNKTKSGIELISGGKASRKKGVENMRELMDIFEAI